MKLVTHENKQGTYADFRDIAKRWYTEQRGRVVGNTVAWDDLTEDQRDTIVEEVELVLATMEAYYTIVRS